VRQKRPPLLVIFGPTGAGKTELAHRVALARGGEIVSADAFAVYRGLDVGTAKPSPARRAEVAYHMLDVASPDEAFSAGRWAEEARAAVEGVTRMNRLPIVCGGSGFYLSALLGGLPVGDVRDPTLRTALSQWAKRRGAAAAHLFLERNDPSSARRIPAGNLRYTIRALEILLATGREASSRARPTADWAAGFRVRKVGLRPAPAQLHVRIEDRVHRMLEEGWDAEVRRLLDMGLSLEANSFQAIGYRQVAEWVLGRISRREAEEQIMAATRALAKRQRTWFARERDATWVAPEESFATTLALLDEEDRETR
jgi:tRNA dimethylallyltransferase